MPTFDSKDVANTFLDLADERGNPLSHMKLQKLLYYAHGWRLALADEPLLNEPIQAWEFGPVVNSIYHEFKVYGRGPIQGRASRFAAESNDVVSISIPQNSSTEDVHALIRRVWDVYSPFSATQLSNMTHLPDSPWTKRVDGIPKPFPRGLLIEDAEIKAHFKKMAERGHAQRSA